VTFFGTPSCGDWFGTAAGDQTTAVLLRGDGHFAQIESVQRGVSEQFLKRLAAGQGHSGLGMEPADPTGLA